MARKSLRFKPSHKDVLRANDAAVRFLAAGRPVPPELLNNVAPKRERAAPRKPEAPVVAAISELLAVHPRVIWAARFNSGMASYEAATGNYAPVWFHKFVRMPEKMRMPDFFGLKLAEYEMTHPGGATGTTLIYALPIAIEAKAPGWTKPRDDREREQAAFLKMIRNAGGIGIFATSVDDVARALG